MENICLEDFPYHLALLIHSMFLLVCVLCVIPLAHPPAGNAKTYVAIWSAYCIHVREISSDKLEVFLIKFISISYSFVEFIHVYIIIKIKFGIDFKKSDDYYTKEIT